MPRVSAGGLVAPLWSFEKPNTLAGGKDGYPRPRWCCAQLSSGGIIPQATAQKGVYFLFSRNAHHAGKRTPCQIKGDKSGRGGVLLVRGANSVCVSLGAYAFR